MSKRKNILPQMFDVKPVKSDGTLNVAKIESMRRTVSINSGKTFDSQNTELLTDGNKSFNQSKLRLADVVSPKKLPRKNISREYHERLTEGPLYESKIDDQLSCISQRENVNQFHPNPSKINHLFEGSPDAYDFSSDYVESKPREINFELPRRKRKAKTWFKKPKLTGLHNFARILNSNLAKIKTKEKDRDDHISQPGLHLQPSLGIQFGHRFSFAVVLVLFSLIVPAFSLLQKAFDTKTKLATTSELAIAQFAEAKDNLASSQFDKAAVDFSQSYEILSDANSDIRKIGGGFSEVLRFVPGISKVASANYVVSAGAHFALAGKNLAESAESLNALGNPLDPANQNNQPSLTDLFLNLQQGIQSSSNELLQAQDDLEKVNIDDLPPEMKDQFVQLKGKLPLVNASLKNFLDYSQIFLDILGYNGPRKYLFLFENNQEMRATGGFIGSYGILDVSNGRIKKLFVDDIYNPDGQLKARVIPPAPIQKMSAVWTMHDANWFPDFPTSAEKVAWFYEKTGGPTVDGVIAITPELLEDLLKVTGPIDMPEYGKTVDADNFTEVTQQEVEVDYDKELNQPKKFVADLTPKILDNVMSEKGLARMAGTLRAFNSALSEKHLLLYSRNFNIQKLISDQKWSGEILNTDKDYLSVINTNINGFKTDGVIDEKIEHHSDIQNDGSIVDTVSITRKHNGGNEKYDWWNKVNGDWMRVYVPKDAKLLEVSGQTREVVSPALDYNSLGFKRDPQVQADEDTMSVDEKSGTQIYSEDNKTVFANWVYVSPGESATVTYKYILPFRLNFDDLHHPADSFSILYQKQSGSVGSRLVSAVSLPQNMKNIWRWPDDLKQDGNSYKMETVLTTDKFVGMAMENSR